MYILRYSDVSVVSSIESADSLNDPFVPNYFAEHGSNAMSFVVISVLFSTFILFFILSFSLLVFLFVDWIIFQGLSSDDGGFDKAILNFYLNHVSLYDLVSIFCWLIFFIHTNYSVISPELECSMPLLL